MGGFFFSQKYGQKLIGYQRGATFIITIIICHPDDDSVRQIKPSEL